MHGTRGCWMLLPVTKWLWKDEFWLPPGFTWEDMRDTDEVSYPHPHHLFACIPLAFLLIALRLVTERVFIMPLGRKLGLQEKVLRKPSPNAVLEAFYSKHQKGPKERELSGLAKQCDMQPRQVERWFRARIRQDQASLTKKFCEACWRSIYYVISFFTGLAIMYNKPWLWDPRECWTEYPQQPLVPSIYFYYIMQLTFYCSLAITLPFDVKRKDHEMQIIHHVATIFLLWFSYCTNCIRIGCLIVLIHDASDVLLEPTKMFYYVKWSRISDTLFLMFSFVFLYVRLVIFPQKVLYNTYYYSMELYQPFLGYYLMNGSLIVLQLLHIFWSYLIIRMVCKFFVRGTMGKDVRSDSEDSENSEENGAEEAVPEKDGKENGSVLSSLNSGGNFISKETPLQLNGSSHPTNSHPKIR
ncbi:ceramide synthase 4 isoform X2 [Paroedura picta]|uniref:ceramide synthase 4 isoform X2 n=1 Tax=Paroedura picta TaxID=143630 RepID=UPI004056BCD8